MQHGNGSHHSHHSHRARAARSVRAICNLALGALLASGICVGLGLASAPEAQARPFERLTQSKIGQAIQNRPKPLQNLIAKAAAGPVPYLVGETLKFGRETAEEIIAEFNAFGGKSCAAGSPCQRFRDDLVAMFDETLDLLDLVPVEAFDGKRLQALRDRVDRGDVRPFALFLLYRAIGEKSPWLEIPYRITETVEQMPAELLKASSNVLFGAPDDPYSFCGRVLVQDPARFKVWKARLGLVKPTIGLISAIMQAVPDIEVGGEAGAAVVNAQGSVTIKVGKIFDVVNKGVGLIVDQITAVMDLELAKYEACNAT